MSVIVDLTAATICFLNSCHPILWGDKTPVGEFRMNKRITEQPGYGGDVIQFYETDSFLIVIHRVWTLSPNQRREKRLQSFTIKDNKITNGCINISPEVYAELFDCCTNQKLIIKR